LIAAGAKHVLLSPRKAARFLENGMPRNSLQCLRAFLPVVLLLSLFLATKPTARAQAKDEARLSLTTHIMDEMAGGHFAAVCEHFTPELKASIDKDRLAAAWNLITAKNGAFRNQISQNARMIQGVPVYVAKSQFEKSKVVLRLTFNSTNQVTDISLGAISDLSPQAMETSSREVANLLAQKQFDQLVLQFMPSLKASMPADRLEMSWSHVMAHLGQFKHVELAVKDPDDDLVDVRCEFEQGDMIVRVGFDPSGKIDGLWMVPAEAVRPQSPDI
jgi:hypothetical protein